MALAWLWRWLRRRPGAVAAAPPPQEDGSRRAAARARFWTELRAGQREAEANKIASLLRPPVRGGEG
jgi:hypothetical protein